MSTSKIKGDPPMENELKSFIVGLLDNVTDIDLLDLVYRLLLDSVQEEPSV